MKLHPLGKRVWKGQDEIVKKRSEFMERAGFTPEAIKRIKKNLPNLHRERTLQDQIDFLRSIGFKDPVKTMTKLPSLITYSKERIKRYIRILEILIARFKLEELDVLDTIENYPNIFCHKEDKLWIIARIIFEKASSESEVTRKKIATLLSHNLEEIVLATRNEEVESLNDLLVAVREIGGEELKKAEKRKRINNLDKKDPLRKRYFRGYPIK